jgi:hypothetical protein
MAIRLDLQTPLPPSGHLLPQGEKGIMPEILRRVNLKHFPCKQSPLSCFTTTVVYLASEQAIKCCKKFGKHNLGRFSCLTAVYSWLPLQ